MDPVLVTLSGGGCILNGFIIALTSGCEDRLLWEGPAATAASGGGLRGTTVWLLRGGRYGDIMGTVLGGLLTMVVSLERNGWYACSLSVCPT